MSDVAERAGIGRATLYKYFPDVETALNAWHQRQVSGHLHQLRALAHEAGETWDRLAAVLQAYAFIVHDMDHQKAKLGAHGPALASVLHRGDHVARAQQHLQDFIQELLAKCASEGQVRSDVPVSELARFCLHALGAAGRLTSKVAAPTAEGDPGRVGPLPLTPGTALPAPPLRRVIQIAGRAVMPARWLRRQAEANAGTAGRSQP
jgi:AcrR family transcriptional regulator